mmetsp:Transcript_32741/g.101376  ORF Transcript_32741/g.101376 Transcript_32741/m.101376 type:complete len:150 (+) Transcript_32741:2202-2651(+)
MTTSFAISQRDAKASPRKPKLSTQRRASKSCSFDVAWRCAIFLKLQGEMPIPLSEHSISEAPCSFSRTSMEVAPASKAFSTSSLTAVDKSTTTCPEQISRTDSASSLDILDGLFSLPVLFVPAVSDPSPMLSQTRFSKGIGVAMLPGLG